MEAVGCSQRRRVHLPGPKQSGGCQGPASGGREGGRDRAGLHGGVTVAPASRCQYVTRRPLVAAGQRTSILKKAHGEQSEKHLGVCREEGRRHNDTDFATRGGELLTPERLSPSRGNSPSPPSASLGEPGSPLRVSDLSAGLCHGEPASGLHSPGGRPARQSLSGCALGVQRLHRPPRPRLTSVVLYPTYAPRSGYPMSGQTGLGGREEGSGLGAKLYSSGRHMEGHSVSPYQTNYWACAIPKAPPPSSDRHSAGWDPDKEYQALLDYTYPLRPGMVVSERDSPELQGLSPPGTDLNLQDSGIEVDHCWGSASLSGLDEPGGESASFGVGFAGSPRADGPPPGASQQALHCSENRCDARRCLHRTLSSTSSSFAAFNRSPRQPLQSGCLCGEVDEEFWPLPERLEELQLLSMQVREVTARLGRPGSAASWESPGPGSTSISPSGNRDTRVTGLGGSSGDEGEDEDGKARGHQGCPALDVAHRGASAAARRESRTSLEPAGGGPGGSSLGEAEALVDRRQGDSLVQHIQVFCSRLEQLIQRLRAASEKTELLAGATVDMGGVKSSLADYQSFQGEVSSHRPLASSVLHSGRLLLGCINATSPFLRDALLLIERQSGALETLR